MMILTFTFQLLTLLTLSLGTLKENLKIFSDCSVHKTLSIQFTGHTLDLVTIPLDCYLFL